jgi:(p)ppGpp synthase/HD superfamily hydrolase
MEAALSGYFILFGGHMIYTDLTKKALRFSYEAHKDQYDKGGVPYVFHALHLAEQLQSEAAVCVALLHDVVEDTEYTIDDIRNMGFPEDVVDAVYCITRTKEMPYMDYIRIVKTNDLATQVKLLDLEHNMDISRLDEADEKAKKRVEKYRKAQSILLGA